MSLDDPASDVGHSYVLKDILQLISLTQLHLVQYDKRHITEVFCVVFCEMFSLCQSEVRLITASIVVCFLVNAKPSVIGYFISSRL